MATVLRSGASALDVPLNGTIGTFRVNGNIGDSKGLEVKYLLTHVTLAETNAKILSMLAPVREVFDLEQLDFDEIMQRDIDDSRVSLDLIPYLLEANSSGQIKLFPPIVAVVLPLKLNSRNPDSHYRTILRTEIDLPEHPGVKEKRITAGVRGQEQFEFAQLSQNGDLLPDGAQLRLSRDNTTLAIVDGQHRAMALLALYRNLKGGWADANKSPYEGYYKVWPESLIRNFDLSELQLPVMICAFPDLDNSVTQNIDVVRAARKVFLTLNKTAKKVSDSRNKLLNDQDIVSECMRESLSYIKDLNIRSEFALRRWNVELDQEGDRTKIGSDVAYSGVSHLYYMTEHLLMSFDYARTTQARTKHGAQRKRLDSAYEKLKLKDILTSDKRNLNSRYNYTDEVRTAFRSQWNKLYMPIQVKILANLHPFKAFSEATISIKNELELKRDTVLDNMLFVGQAISRTFDDFHAGLNLKASEGNPGWSTPEIETTLKDLQAIEGNRAAVIERMRNIRADKLLDRSKKGFKKIYKDDVLSKSVRNTIDKLYANVFGTVAFQAAVVCTYVEAVIIAHGGIDASNDDMVNNYIESLNGFFKPDTFEKLNALFSVFEGKIHVDGENVQVIVGGPTFKHVVLHSNEMQPVEWPKTRYILLEIWKTSDEKLASLISNDCMVARKHVSQALLRRRISDYCIEHRITEEELTKEAIAEIQGRTKSMYESFLQNLKGEAVILDEAMFALSPQQSSTNGQISIENIDDMEDETL